MNPNSCHLALDSDLFISCDVNAPKFGLVDNQSKLGLIDYERKVAPVTDESKIAFVGIPVIN